MEIFLIIAAVLVVGYLVNENRKSKKSSAPTTTTKALYPCVIEGTIDHSPQADKLKALQIEAASKGIAMTGDYWTDVAAQGGEMTLAGNFRILLDKNGQVTDTITKEDADGKVTILATNQHFNLFGSLASQITGGADGNGVLGMDANFNGAIINLRGKISNGKLENGRAIKSWLPHIYGIMNGNVQSL